MEIEKKFTREANAETNTTVDLFVDKSTKELKFLDRYKQETVLASKANYKVITGRFQQKNSDYMEGPLVIGETYYISEYSRGDDFINVGAESNDPGITFVATGTTPDSWDNRSVLINAAESVGTLTIFENTLGNITTGWSGGSAFFLCNDLFVEGKTWTTSDIYGSSVYLLFEGANSCTINGSLDAINQGFSFEIRVYN